MEFINFNYLPDKGRKFLRNIKNKRGIFLCTISHTETSSIPGVSAAGANTELIKYTPAADIEAIYYGTAKCLDGVPENPSGPPSPVIISIASLELLKIPFFPINAGVKIIPSAPMYEVNRNYGERIDYGDALGKIDFNEMLEKTKILANELAKSFEYVVLGESVPGGTTTAMAIIKGLGYDSYNKISGSMPGNQHELKINVVNKAISFINDSDTPMDIVSKIGDPMQPVQAILTIELAKKDVKVFLAGGTQMVAVATLIKSFTENKTIFRNIAIGTTKWVSQDKDSDIVGLMEHINLDIPLVSSGLDFSDSNYKNLQLYEEGYVKEGVGAGAIAVTAFNDTKITNNEFLERIENIYRKIYNK